LRTTSALVLIISAVIKNLQLMCPTQVGKLGTESAGILAV
jgi:hypothetical protein